MGSRNHNISSAPVMEEHIHLCHKRILEYENEQKRLQSIIVLLGETLSNVVNTCQGFQHEAHSANENVGELISGVENASKILQRIRVEDEAVEKSNALTQVEIAAMNSVSLVVAQDSMENSSKQNRSDGGANELQKNLENMDSISKTNQTSFDEDKSEKNISSSKVLMSSFDAHSQQSSMESLHTTTEISEEYLSGFLVKFWQKIGSAVNALNNTEDKIKIFASKEMSNLKASLESDMNELCVYLRRKCELLKQMKLSLDSESKFRDSLFELENKLNNQVLHTGDLKGEIQESLSDKQKSELINVKEQLGLIIGRLGVRTKHSTKYDECLNEEQIMKLKKLIVDSSEPNSNCESAIKVFHSKFEESEIEVDGANIVTIPRTDLDKLYKESEKWKRTCQSLKNVIVNLTEHINNCEEELNGTLVQSILRLSGVNDECDFTNGKSNGEQLSRKVHFAPSVLTNILPQHEVQGEDEESILMHLEESSEDLRTELKICLEKLKVEANALLSLTGSLKQKGELIDGQSHLELMDKILLLENHLKVETMEKDRLKVEIHTLKGLCEGHSATEAALVARATKAESQLAAILLKKGNTHENLEMVTEGIGEGGGPSNFDKLLYKLTQIKEKAQGVLKLQHEQEGMKPDSSGFLLMEGICCEVDRLFEDTRRENEDLQLQVESADKQLRSNRAFLEEQAIEREQEREEYQKELNQLREVMNGRERDKEEKERMIGEGKPLASERQDQGINFPPRLTVEFLEQQCKQLTQLLQDTTSKKDEDEAELKAAVDKIWDLRDIIRELESQVENGFQVQKELRSQNESLITEVDIQKKKLNDLLEELESLRSSLGFNVPSELENENHTTLLEEALRKHCFQVEQAKALASSFKEFKKQLLEMGTAIDMKTKELEALQVTPVTVANCNSPSEDVSVREQLEQATWRSESPLEDDFSSRDLSGNTNEIDIKGLTAFALPKVPFAELCHLQEKLMRYAQVQEPLLKRMHDLEMQIQSLKQSEEELMTEREVLQSQVEEQLLQASELQARLDEARRRGGQHIHCIPVTPIPSLTRSPLGSPSTKTELPSFCCAGLADARHEIENLTECLEKKELEVTQLRRALEDSKKVVALQEKELTDRLKEEAETLEKLKDYEQIKSDKDALQMKLSCKSSIDAGAVPFSLLLDNLLAEKNEEIEFLRQKIEMLQDRLSKGPLSEEIMNLNHPNESNLSNEDRETSDYNEKSSGGSQEEVEVLRDHGIQRSSIDQLSGDIYHKDDEHSHKLWFHSTKIDVQNSPIDSPGLTFSPLTPPKKEVSVVIEEPELEEESLEKIPSTSLFSTSNTTNTVEALQQVVLAKNDEIGTLKNKVDELSKNKDSLMQLITELREKIEWHSKHLEKYEEESLGREALIAQVQNEKSELESALKVAEQEVNTWKSSHDKIKDKIVSQEEQIENLKAKVDKYCKANKEQHLLLKTAQQERKHIISLVSDLGTGDYKDNESNHLKISTPTSPNGNLKDQIMKFVDQLQSLRIEVGYLKGERNQLKEDLEKAIKLQSVTSIKEPPGNVSNETERQEIEDVNHNSEKLEPNSIQVARGSSPSLVSLEQMMQKVQREGIEVLSLSELAMGKRSTPIDTPITGSPFGSPKSSYSTSNIVSKANSSVGSLKEKKANIFSEDDRVKLLMQIQALENELSSKEREDLRRRDWLEFQEKEGVAGWTGMVEAVGQKQRHQLSILEQLGQQRNARARLEASVDHLQQQLSQAETELRKVTYRLGMERSHVIRLESALQQEKCNFSQLQQSLDLERKRANMMKELNSKVIKTLQSELVQYQSKSVYLHKSLKEEHDLRMELEVQLKQIQRDQGYIAENAERDNLASEECRQLRKIEEECERKALEQELESEKQKRIQCQKELVHLRNVLESRPKHEKYEAGRRWSSSEFPPTACGSDTSFNAEDMLQNLKGINQVLGWHLRERDDYQKASIASVEMEKHYLEAKCCQLEQKLETLQSMMEQDRMRWANEKSLVMENQQSLPKVSENISRNLPEELVKFKELVQQLYSLYWRSERNRKALAWQKQYFLSILSTLKILKVDPPMDISKTNEEDNVFVTNITGLERLHYFSHHSQRKPKSHMSFRVLVWTVIATLKMKVLVLRSITGMQVGCRSLLETILLPTLSHPRIQPSLCNQQAKQPYSEASGECEIPSSVMFLESPSSSSFKKNKSFGGMIYQPFP